MTKARKGQKCFQEKKFGEKTKLFSCQENKTETKGKKERQIRGEGKGKKGNKQKFKSYKER